MRTAFSAQRRLDCQSVPKVALNFNCRDEIVPILRALQYIYEQPATRKQILDAIGEDVNRSTDPKRGRQGMDYWEILVLAAVRLGCNLDYDKLQDLAENHRALRHIMGLGDWSDAAQDFDWRRIQDNVCLLKPETFEKISEAIVATGHRLEPQAAEKLRADFFVVETNIHWPTDSSLIRDGIRKIIEQCVAINQVLKVSGWRQSQHWLKKIKRLARDIDRIASRKGANLAARLKKKYSELLNESGVIVERARQLAKRAAKHSGLNLQVEELRHFIELTERVRALARRRVLEGETVPNDEKLFSLFETHTQLFKRGKAGEPIQFGRMALIYEDSAGFVLHSYVLDREELERDVVVRETKAAKRKAKGKVKSVSFDRGCHSPKNQQELGELLEQVCLPKPGAKQAAEQERTATTSFREARQRHPGVESAIGALQAGNGLKRCRDRSDIGLKRYVALGILGRNLHVLGKILIRRDAELSEAAYSRRKPAAA
jgi:IS5 family transposase